MPESEEPKRPAPGGPGKPLPRLWKYADEEAEAQAEDEYGLVPEEEAEPELDEAGEPLKKVDGTAGKKPKPAQPLPRMKAVENSRSVEKSKPRDKAAPIDRVRPVGAGHGSAPVKKSVEKPSKPAKKPRDDSGDAKKKGALVEETPEFETYETRQRVRIGISVFLVVAFLFMGYSILKPLLSGGADESASDPAELAAAASPSTAAPAVNLREKAEQEARMLFKRAEDVGRGGNTEMAVKLLKKVTTSYPSTNVALEAQQALDRPKQNLPLFPDRDRPPVLASPTDSKPPVPASVQAKAPVSVVDATKPAVPGTPEAEASLVLPRNPAETGRTNPMPTPTPSPGAPEVVVKPLPTGFRPRPGAVVHPSGWPSEIVGDRDGAPMMLVPGGTFLQGRDDGEAAEAPEHKVNLGSYYIDKHEATVRQFDLFQKEKGRRSERIRALSKEKDPAIASAAEVEDMPVVMVSAREASDFASWANKRLPTEAQWEAAARTPDGRIHPWGADKPHWEKPRAPRRIDPVMSYPTDVSPYGVFDLAGNAWEWTKDWYDPRYYQTIRGGTADNPTGPAPSVRPRSMQLVVKGGSRDWSASKRDTFKFDTRLPYLGFRCVLQVEGPGNAFEPPPSASPKNGPAGAASGGDSVPF